MELTPAVFCVEGARERTLGSFFAKHAVGGGAQAFSPLSVAETHWVGVRRGRGALGTSAIAGAEEGKGAEAAKKRSSLHVYKMPEREVC